MTAGGSGTWSRIRPLVGEAFWPVVFFSAIALVAELTLRFGFPLPEPKPYHTSMVTHDGRSVSYTDGPIQLELSTNTFYRTRPGQQFPYLTINERGLRGESVSAKGEHVRVLVLGASTAFGVGAENDEDTFVERLEALHPGIETINGAVIGFVVTQQLTFLVSELLELQPDVVITVDSYADIFDAWYGEVIGQEQKPAHQLAYNTLILPQVESQLVDHYALEQSLLGSLGHSIHLVLRASRLYSALEERVFALQQRVSAMQEESSALTVKSVMMDEDYFQRVLEGYVNTLQTINTVCEAHGAKHVSVLQPDLGLKEPRSDDEERFMNEIDSMVPGYRHGYVPTFSRFTSEADTRLREAGIPVWNSNHSEILMNNSETLFVDMAHLNSRGNEVFAEALMGWLLDEAILPPRPE